MLWGSLTSLHLYPRWFISHRKDSRRHLWSVHVCLLVQQLSRVSLGVFNNWADDDSVVAGLHSHHGSSGGRERCSAGLVLSVQTGAAWFRCPTHARTQAHSLAVTHTLHEYVCVFSGYFRDDILCHFCASMISGLVTTAASMPVDIVKTRWDWRRLMNSSSVVEPSLTTFSFFLAGSRTWRWSTGSQSIKTVWWVANFICFYLFLLLHFGH